MAEPTQLLDGAFLELGTAAVVGALGGLARAATTDPKSREWVKNLLVGVVAAVGSLFVFEAKTDAALVALTLLAGYSGKALIDALEARVLLATTRQKLALAEDDNEAALVVADEALALARRDGPHALRHAQAREESNTPIEPERAVTVLQGRIDALRTRAGRRHSL